MQFKYIFALSIALLTAAIAPAILTAILDGTVKLVAIVFFIALVHAVILGLPLFLILSVKTKINWFISTICGFIIASIPVGIFTWPYQPGDAFNSWVGEKQTIINGVPTSYGWLNYILEILLFGGYGAIGGFTFWIVFINLQKNYFGDRYLRFNILQIALITTISITASLIILTPIITEDRSCHNVLRDGRKSISPEVSMELDIPYEDWAKLIEVSSNYSLNNKLEFRNSSDIKTSAYKILYISICDESGFQITVMQQKWPSNNFENVIPISGVSVSVYEMGSNTRWKDFANLFIANLENIWPGKIKYTGENGKQVPKDSTLLK